MEQNNDLTDKLNQRILEWFDKLEEHEKMQTKFLDAYFAARCNLPQKSVTGEEYVEEDKSTQDIMDDLADMVALDRVVVIAYMRVHEYALKTTEEGGVKWAVWRNYHFPL